MEMKMEKEKMDRRRVLITLTLINVLSLDGLQSIAVPSSLRIDVSSLVQQQSDHRLLAPVRSGLQNIAVLSSLRIDVGSATIGPPPRGPGARRLAEHCRTLLLAH